MAKRNHFDRVVRDLINPAKPDVIELIDARQSADVSMSSLNDSCMSIDVEPSSEEMLKDAESMLAEDDQSWKQKMERYSKAEIIAMLEAKIIASEKSAAELKRLEPVSNLFVKDKVIIFVQIFSPHLIGLFNT